MARPMTAAFARSKSRCTSTTCAQRFSTGWAWTTAFSCTHPPQLDIMLLAGASAYGILRLNQERIMKPQALLLSLPVLWAINTLGAARPDLTGSVVTEARQPVPEATVFIYTAGPRVGP